MLIDDVKITVTSGNGGEGAFTYLGFKKGVKVGPTGGDGGRGGNVYFLGSNNVTDLSKFQFAKEVKAENGTRGMSKNHNGKNASDITVLVPIGTKVIDSITEKEYEVNDTNNPILIARGGEGELGSFRLAKGNEQITNRAGEVKTLHLILSLIADIGLIGLPNTGKSSLLDKLTSANPKIGDYPFTTLEPNRGALHIDYGSQSTAKKAVDSSPKAESKPSTLILADIPGLIEDASVGHGLGIKFLKHIEKTKILVHCISAEDPKPLRSYQIVRGEFGKYNPDLLKKEELILITKKDLATEDDIRKKIKLFKNSNIMSVSVYEPESIDELKNKLLSLN